MQVRYQLRHSPLKGYLVVGVVILGEGKAYLCPASGHLLGLEREAISRCTPAGAMRDQTLNPFR